MDKEHYLKLNKCVNSNNNIKKLIKSVNTVITGFTYIFFIAYAIYLIVYNFKLGLRLCLVCGIPFIFISIIRKLYNAPRPYDLYDIIPVIEKDSHGKSFPSRHVFSIFIIGTSMLFILKPAGVILIFCGIVLAFLRVIGGVHFINDVITGALLGILFAVLGFII